MGEASPTKPPREEDCVPIYRTFQCPECNHRIEVVLTAEQWDAPPPSCPSCDAHEMGQEFKPPAIGGSIAARAARITEDIIANDYQVANFRPDNRDGGTPQVRYKDETPGLTPGAWAAAQQTLQQAIDVGRAQRRTRYEKGPSGSGMDLLASALASGEQPDLIHESKKRAIKVW